MCGIVGAFPLNKPDLQISQDTRRLLTLFLHNEVLFETVVRGRDSTGIAASFGRPYKEVEEKLRKSAVSKYWAVLKQPVDTEDFFLNDGSLERYKGQDEDANIERMMDVACLLQRPLRHILGHTRKKTIGSEYNSLNNHPIIVGNIIGIHNGGVKNHEIIYDKHRKMTPQGEVDSEVIFQLLAETAPDRPLGARDIEYVTQRIEGPHAIIGYNRNHPESVIYFHDRDRPLELAYIEELGLALLCSEKRFMLKAMHVYSRARLTLKRDLPPLSVVWRNIPDNKGGVIDVTTETSDGDNIEELFPLVNCKDTLQTYKKPPTYHNNHTEHVGNNYNNHNRGGNTNSSTPHNRSTSATTKTEASVTTITRKVEEAEIIDLNELAGYGSDVDESQDAAGKMESVVAEAIMDDADENSKPTSVMDVYEEDDLREQGVEYALGEEAVGNKSLLINRHKGKYNKLLSFPKMEENDATEVVHALFPDMFSEGYAVGFRRGVETQEAIQGDNSVTEEEAVVLQKSLSRALGSIKDLQDKNHRAGRLIANMKAFLMATIITCQIGRVTGTGKDTRLVFDSDLEDFLCTAAGFSKTNPKLVRDLFEDKDLRILANGLSQTARRISEEHEEEIQNAAL